MRINAKQDTKNEKCKRNVQLQQRELLHVDSCAEKITARDLKYSKGNNYNVRVTHPALKLRHSVCKENDLHNSCVRAFSIKVTSFNKVVYSQTDKRSEVKSFKDCQEKENLHEAKCFKGCQEKENLHEVKSFKDCQEKEHHEKCAVSDYTLRKAQVRLDFGEKHEIEKLKSLLSSSQKPEHVDKFEGLDWMFKYSAGPPAQQDQAVYMMNSVAKDQDVDIHVQPLNIPRDSGFQGSNATTEEPQGKTTDQVTEQNTLEFYENYIRGSDDFHCTERTGPGTPRQAIQALGDGREEGGVEMVEREKETAEEEEIEDEEIEDDEEISHMVLEDVNVVGDDFAYHLPEAEQQSASDDERIGVPTPPADQSHGQSQEFSLEGDYEDIHDPNPRKVDNPRSLTARQYPEYIYDVNSLTVDGPESGDEDSLPSNPDSINFPQNRNNNEVQNLQVAAEQFDAAAPANICGNQSRSTLEGIPAQLRSAAQGNQEGLIDTEGAQARPTQGAQARTFVQDTQGNFSGRAPHEGHLSRVILEAGHQEQLIQQCLQRVTGGNTQLAKLFLSHLQPDRLQSQHCGVIVCRALQTILDRGEGGKFTSDHRPGQYFVDSEVGRGGYGIVSLCEAVIENGDRLESVKFARKRMPIRRFNVQEAMLYIDCGQRLPWMLDFKGIVRDGDNIDLLLQYAPGGSLVQWIEKPNLRTVDSIGQSAMYNQIHCIVYQILCCTSDLNQLKKVHWDIKASNVLFTTEDCQGRSATLSDTGTAKAWEDVQHNGIPHLDGTVIFFPPEIEEVCVLVEDFLDLELVDAWNVGATIYHVLTRHHLWFEEKQEFRMKYGQDWRKHMRDYVLYEGWRVCEIINKIDQSQYPLVTPFVFVMSLLLEYDACRRRTVTEVLDLPVFSEMRQQQIPSCVAGMGDPHVGGVTMIPIPECRAGKMRRFPGNPYAKLVVFHENTAIYLQYFQRSRGLHVQHLASDAKFLKQLELHVPNFEDGYSLLCPTRDRLSGEMVLMNGGTIHQDTYVYLTTCGQSS